MRKGFRAKPADSPTHGAAGETFDLPSTLLDSNRRMFEQQDGCDVIFAVKGPGDAAETKIGAHRYVLCSRSPVFHRTLQWGSKSPPDKKLKENDFPALVFREFLRFVNHPPPTNKALEAIKVP